MITTKLNTSELFRIFYMYNSADIFEVSNKRNSGNFKC